MDAASTSLRPSLWLRPVLDKLVVSIDFEPRCRESPTPNRIFGEKNFPVPLSRNHGTYSLNNPNPNMTWNCVLN